MTSKGILATLCSLLLVYVPAVGAATPAAIGKLNSTGPAEVNGIVVAAETTVFPGDRIVTQNGATASLSLTAGSQLIVVESSSLQIKGSGEQSTMALDRGGLAVFSRASAPVLVEAAGARVRPAKGGAVFAVTVNGNHLKVIASKGAAEVEAADRTIEVSEGKTLEATMAPPQEPAGSGTPIRSPFAMVLIVTTAAAAFTALGIAVKKLTESCKGTASPFSVSCN